MKYIVRLLKFYWVVVSISLAGFTGSSIVAYGEPLTPASTSTASSSAPTVVLNDSSIVQNTTKRVGLNIGSINFWDNGQLLKNLIGGMNPGFEPVQSRQVWLITSQGTTTSFTDPDQWDAVPANYWTGGTFTVVASATGGAELGCTGTIASNTGPNYPNYPPVAINPSFTMSQPCAAPFNNGDVVIFSKNVSTTPESQWENNQGGFWTYISGGGKLLSDNNDLCATCGTQALQLNASAPGSVAQINGGFDANSPNADIYVLMNGTYEISFWAKAAAGSPTLSVSANRGASGGFNCGPYNPVLTPTWTQYTFTCQANETQASTSLGGATVTFKAEGGAVDLDNASFAKSSGNPANTSVFRDEAIAALQRFYQTSSGGNSGVLRDWLGQNGETMDNWTKPDYARRPTSTGVGYYIGPGGAGNMQLSLEDYLVICQLVHADPYLEVPVTFTTQDAAALIEFLAAPSSTTYGGRRAALGQSSPWTSVFSQIHLSFCNECWNGGTFPGQNIPWREGQPNSETFYDYSARAGVIYAAMHADGYYSSSAFDLVLNALEVDNASMDAAIARSKPDSIEFATYDYGTVTGFSSDADLWGAAMVEPWDNVIDPSSPTNFHQSATFYNSQKTCGASGTATCRTNLYEWGQGTTGGTVDQTHLDHINAGGGVGVVVALQSLLNMQYFGINSQAYFAFTGVFNNGPNRESSKLYGNVVDIGGATNNVRPQFLALSLVNQSIIGPMYSCPISNNATYNFAGNPNNGLSVPPGMPALSNVPYLYAFCFENGTKRSIVLVNTDLTGSHTIGFSGTSIPAGAVTQRQFAPAGLDDMNEAPTGEPTNLTQAKVALTTTTLSRPSSLTLPPHSVTALDFGGGVSSTTQTATPVISPAGGSYTSSLLVTMGDSTTGATIYYTTDGSTPTTASRVYGGPIAVTATQAVQAIAAASGDSNSAVASAAYTITGPTQVAAPVFNPAGGSYSTAQTVTITDSTKKATIYYTTDGSTPTTSSKVYSDPITVSATQTLQAIAAASRSSSTAAIVTNAATVTTSAVATATYTIAPVVTTGLPDYPTSMTATGLAFNGSAKIANSALVVTNGGSGEAGSAWYATKVPVNVFTSDFTFQLLNPHADGFTFAIQNAAKGTGVLGGAGGALGYGAIGSSVALKFDLHNNGGEGPDSTGIYLNGANPTQPSTNLTPTGVNLHSGDVFHAHVTYDGATLTLVLTDTVTGASATEKYTVNIPATVGGNTAYVGFTGGTGGSSAIQNILTWTYSSTSTTSTTVAMPAFSPASGSYSSAQSVTISDSTTGARIYYTTDGSTPTTSSHVYSGPVAVSATETLKAIATDSGDTNSAVASAGYTIASTGTTNLPNYPTGLTSTGLAFNGVAKVTNGALVLTNGGADEAGTAWYTTKVPISAFTSDFTFQQLNPSGDGFTFTIQNSSNGTKALGPSGGELGYTYTGSSVAVKFDLYSNAGEGPDSTGIYLNGASPTVPATDLSSTGINLHSGDVFHAHLAYNGTTLALTITDTLTGATVTEKYTVNIPAAVGGNTAYVGFTGGTGGCTSTQEILNWTYTAQ